MDNVKTKSKNSFLYGLLAGAGILVFYIAVLSIFEGFNLALLSFSNLKYWLIVLAAGFGTQIGLWTSIRHTAKVNEVVAGTGGVSGGSMVACCSHFLLNIIPIAGFSGLAVALMAYQKWFFGFGILANFVGIGFLLKHKKKMKANQRFPFKRQRHLKGGCSPK